MATPPSLNYIYVEDYEPKNGKGTLAEEQIVSSLRSVYKYLKKKGELSSKELDIAKYALDNLATHAKNCEKKVTKIKERIKAEDHPLNEFANTTIFKNVKKIFFPTQCSEMVIVTPAQTDAMSLELLRLHLVEFYNTRWILMGATQEDIIRENQKEEEKASEASETPPANSLPLLQVIPDPSLETRLMRFNETSMKLELQAKSIRDNQKDIITGFGHAVFNDYIVESVQWIRSRFIHLLKDESLPKQVTALTSKQNLVDFAVSPQTPPVQKPSLLNRIVHNQAKHTLAGIQQSHSEIVKVLITQARSTLSGMHETFQDVIKDDSLREQFPSLVLSYVPQHITKEMNPEVRKLIIFILKNYLPDMMEAGTAKMKSILGKPEESQKLGEYLVRFICNYGADYQVGLIELFSFILQHNIPEPAEAASEALLAKLQDQRLNTELTALLKNLLLDSFFPKPTNVTKTNKKIIVGIISNLRLFLNSLNDAITAQSKAPTSLPNPSSQVASIMYQQLFTKGGILAGKCFDKTIDFSVFYLRAQLEDLVLAILFPGIKHTDAKFPQKIAVMTIAAFAQKILGDIFKPNTLQIIFEKILTDPLLLENPFELDLPSIDFDADDKEFSKDLDINIKSICQEVVKLIDNFLIRAAGEKLIHYIPELGDRVQRELNKIFNSGVSLVPILYPLQILYKLKVVEPVKVPASMAPRIKMEIRLSLLQSRFFKTLAVPRTPALKLVLNEKPAETAARQSRVDKLFLTKGDRLEQLIESKLPFGTRDVALEVLRKLYVFSREDLILKILLMYIINGLKTGIEEGGMRKAEGGK